MHCRCNFRIKRNPSYYICHDIDERICAGFSGTKDIPCLHLPLQVLVTTIVGEEANQDSTSNFIYIGKPLLISTVALGGAVNLVPVCFAKVSYNNCSMLFTVTR
jgi:hypothetical protein